MAYPDGSISTYLRPLDPTSFRPNEDPVVRAGIERGMSVLYRAIDERAAALGPFLDVHTEKMLMLGSLPLEQGTYRSVDDALHASWQLESRTSIVPPDIVANWDKDKGGEQPSLITRTHIQAIGAPVPRAEQPELFYAAQAVQDEQSFRKRPRLLRQPHLLGVEGIPTRSCFRRRYTYANPDTLVQLREAMGHQLFSLPKVAIAASMSIDSTRGVSFRHPDMFYVGDAEAAPAQEQAVRYRLLGAIVALQTEQSDEI